MSEPRRAGLPAHLAAAGAEATESAGPAASAKGGRKRLPRVGDVRAGEEMFGCPCPCGCGNLTSIPARAAALHSSSKYLRCDDCARLGGEHAATAPPKAEQPNPEIRPLVRVVNPIDAELDREADAEQARIYREQDWAKWQETLPDKFRNACLDERVDEKNKQGIQDRLALLREGKAAGAVINGRLGAGKSWLAYSYAAEALREGLLRSGQIKHGSEVDLFGNIAVAPWNERAALLRSLLSPRLRMLIIDDVGREMRMKAAERRSLYDQITDMAWSDGRALVITTNLLNGDPTNGGQVQKSERELDDYLFGWVGAAAYDRIRASCGRGPIIVPDRQMRAQLHEEEFGSAAQQ